jgi:hypothetical protein
VRQSAPTVRDATTAASAIKPAATIQPPTPIERTFQRAMIEFVPFSLRDAENARHKLTERAARARALDSRR